MRPTTLLAAALLLTPALAHADTFYTYTGSVLLNGNYLFGTDPYSATEIDYVNVPLSATIVLGDKQFGGYGVPSDLLYIASDVVQFPSSGEFFQDTFPFEGLNFPYCLNFNEFCTEVYTSNYENTAEFGLASSVTLYGQQVFTDPSSDDFRSTQVYYGGDLYLVTTPEPSTFVLLASGLAVAISATRRRFIR